MKVLHADRLARLANHDVENEPLLRRITVDKSAKRVRQVLSGALWDTKLTQWLHLALVDNLPTEYLASYLDIMQTLKGKIPTLADKMMSGKVYHEMYENVPADGIRILLNSKWDPASSGLSEAKLVWFLICFLI
jgi:regulatory NSL complex subunit 3